MGWLWGANEPSEPNSASSNTNSDPLRDLDPSLRDFLNTDSPSTYKPTPSPSPPKPHPGTTPDTDASIAEALTDNSTSATSKSSSTTSAAPSAYSDGRYADLWSTYRPLAVVENEGKSDHEKLMDVLEGYKQRKSDIAGAALENCALEQGAVGECLKTGGWMKRMTMCREENRAFERCYVMQSRFLKALGYLSSPRPAIVEEEIQMHADTLYHRMLAQEAAIAAAKASNAPVPNFPPIIATTFSTTTTSSPASLPPSPPSSSPSSTTTASPTLSSHLPPPPSPPASSSSSSSPPTLPPEQAFSTANLTPAGRDALQDRLKGLSPEERKLEEFVTAMEASQSDAVGKTVQSILDETERKRRERREKGEAKFGDVISSWFGR